MKPVIIDRVNGLWFGGQALLIVVIRSDNIPIHVVCGWRGKRIVIVTVYVPKPSKFIIVATLWQENPASTIPEQFIM